MPYTRWRGQCRRFRTGAVLAGSLLLSACYDDTPMTLKIIDGETDRTLYAQTLLDAASAVRAGQVPDAATREAVEFAYKQSQQAYIRLLMCVEDGPCRWSGLRPLCDDVARLLAAREVLAPYSELLAVSEQLRSDKGPLAMERVQALRTQVARDGRVTALEEDILLHATAAAAAHSVYALTPAGARESARYLETHAIDAFQLRCAAG